MKNFPFVLLTVIAQLFSFSTGAKGEQKAELIVEKEHADSINAFAFSPNGKLFASASEDHTVKLGVT